MALSLDAPINELLQATGSGRLSLRVSWCIWAGVWPGGLLPQLIQKRNEVAGHIGWAKQSLGGPREEQTKVTCSNMENHFFVTDPPGVLGPPQGLTTTGGIVWGIRGYSFLPRWHWFFKFDVVD